VCDRLRGVLPTLLAVSANSPFLDARHSGLHSARTQSFTKTFPRCGIPDAYGSWAEYRRYIELLLATNSIVEYTQIWWSVRPHATYGTVEVRIADAQITAGESDGLASLIVACVGQALRDIDEGVPFDDPAPRLIEENIWRAVRYGMDGHMIDLRRGVELPTRAALEDLWTWTAPVRAEQRIDVALDGPNGAQRQRAAHHAGASLQEVYADTVRETTTTYAQEVPA
jgi:carboxylate-amine ligase